MEAAYLFYPYCDQHFKPSAPTETCDTNFGNYAFYNSFYLSEYQYPFKYLVNW
jgi:hypothetical protein